MVYAKNVVDHKQVVVEILEILGKHNLWLKPQKCEFSKSKVKYLGVVISHNCNRMDMATLKKVSDWPALKISKFSNTLSNSQMCTKHLSTTSQQLLNHSTKWQIMTTPLCGPRSVTKNLKYWRRCLFFKSTSCGPIKTIHAGVWLLKLCTERSPVTTLWEEQRAAPHDSPVSIIDPDKRELRELWPHPRNGKIN